MMKRLALFSLPIFITHNLFAKTGRTAIELASSSGKMEVVEFLLRKGATKVLLKIPLI